MVKISLQLTPHVRYQRSIQTMHTSVDSVDEELARVYYDVKDPASYGGVERLYERAQELKIPANRGRVRKFLAEQVAYQLHKPARHTFVRNQTVVADIDEQWQADLADMHTISRENKGYRFILTCVDVLSRYAWAVPVRSKSGNDMLVAMRALFHLAAPRRPKRLQTDKGTEFYNARVRQFLSEQGVELFSTNSDKKAALVERFNRTLKARIYKHFTAWKTRRYVDVLQDIVDGYNQSYHRTIGRRPADVVTEDDAKEVWRRVYYDSKEAQLRPADRRVHAVNADHEYVRLSKVKGAFDKGYIPNWGREHYEVVYMRPQRRGGMPRPVYKLKDTMGEDIEGACYPEEIQHIPEPATHIIEVERVLRQRRVDKQAEYLVKFKGWPHKFNRWLTKPELEQYRKPLRQQQQEQQWKTPTSL
jgi:transposase InsO family protein